MNNPCIDCITYIMCRNRLIKEFSRLSKIIITHNVSREWDLSPHEALLYRAAENVLVNECNLIYDYIMRTSTNYLMYVKDVVKVINKTYSIVDEKGNYEHQ
jgi:hypothetical protein